MTALAGPILFNSSTGSDSLASGLGPATAVNSTTEGTTASYSSTTITFSGATDLSGVSAGHLLYLVTSTGRKFFAIASVDDGADTVTVDEAPTGTTSGLSWAIGGKRATLDDANSRTLFGSDGAEEDWILQLETDQTITSSTISCGALSRLIVQSDSSSTRRVITHTANVAMFTMATNPIIMVFKHIELRNSNATKTAADGFLQTANVVTWLKFYDCILGHATDSLNRAIAVTNGSFSVLFWHSSVRECVNTNAIQGTFLSGTRVAAYQTQFVDNSGTAFLNGTNGGSSTTEFVDCVFARNGGDGIDMDGIGKTGERVLVKGCIFFDNDGAGLDLGPTAYEGAVITGNVFVNNGTYGIDVSSGVTDEQSGLFDFNAFYGNTSGDVTGVSNGPNDITLTADPFVDSANGDFNINTDANGGQLLRDAVLTLPG